MLHEILNVNCCYDTNHNFPIINIDALIWYLFEISEQWGFTKNKSIWSRKIPRVSSRGGNHIWRWPYDMYNCQMKTGTMTPPNTPASSHGWSRRPLIGTVRHRDITSRCSKPMRPWYWGWYCVAPGHWFSWRGVKYPFRNTFKWLIKTSHNSPTGYGPEFHVRRVVLP